MLGLKERKRKKEDINTCIFFKYASFRHWVSIPKLKNIQSNESYWALHFILSQGGRMKRRNFPRPQWSSPSPSPSQPQVVACECWSPHNGCDWGICRENLVSREILGLPSQTSSGDKDKKNLYMYFFHLFQFSNIILNQTPSPYHLKVRYHWI